MSRETTLLTDRQHAYGLDVHVNPLLKVYVQVTRHKISKGSLHSLQTFTVTSTSWIFGTVMPSIGNANSYFSSHDVIHNDSYLGFESEIDLPAGLTPSISLAWYFHLLLHESKKKRRVSRP